MSSQELVPTTLKLHEDSQGRLADIPIDKMPHGVFLIKMEAIARDPCPEHGYAHHPLDNELDYLTGAPLHPREMWDPFPDCKGGIIGTITKDFDQSVIAFAQLLRTNIFAASDTIVDLTNTSRAINANQANTSPTIVAGTSGTAPAFSDYKLGTATSGSSGFIAGTVNTMASNTFTITGTVANSSGSTITYAELGLTVVNSTWTFLVAHDTINSGSGFPVSTGGNLQSTYTVTCT